MYIPIKCQFSVQNFQFLFCPFAGPATIRMVSTNERPPVAMPMHVPQGHMVQQIVDENGTLQHVILSADPMAGAAAPPQGVAPTPLPSGGPSPALQGGGGGSSSPPTSAPSSTNTSTTPGSAGATPGPQQPPTGPPGSSGQQFVPMTLYVSLQICFFFCSLLSLLRSYRVCARDA